jgi:hypothetical protein
MVIELIVSCADGLDEIARLSVVRRPNLMISLCDEPVLLSSIPRDLHISTRKMS